MYLFYGVIGNCRRVCAATSQREIVRLSPCQWDEANLPWLLQREEQQLTGGWNQQQQRDRYPHDHNHRNFQPHHYHHHHDPPPPPPHHLTFVINIISTLIDSWNCRHRDHCPHRLIITMISTIIIVVILLLIRVLFLHLLVFYRNFLRSRCSSSV